MNLAPDGQSSSFVPPLSRFVVRSSDVIQDMRVNVSDENSDTVIWYKERYLNDEEIVEHVVHSPTNTICWTIHRPKRGWYIRIRSPIFAPGVFIPMVPVPNTSPHYTDAALLFKTRTNLHTTRANDQDPTPQEHDNTPTAHSYPPPLPAVITHTPPPSSVTTQLDGTTEAQRASHVHSSTQVTQFILAPHLTQPVQPMNTSFFARAVSALKSHRPSHSNSFTISRFPFTASPSPPSYASSTGSPIDPTQTISPSLSMPPSSPLLLFHDRTPILTVRSITGLIEIDRTEEQLLGVETSFWIAVALTYLEFLEERDVELPGGSQRLTPPQGRDQPAEYAPIIFHILRVSQLAFAYAGVRNIQSHSVYV